MWIILYNPFYGYSEYMLEWIYGTYDLSELSPLFLSIRLPILYNALKKGKPKLPAPPAIHGNNKAILSAEYPFETVKRVGSWALWREVLGYKNFLSDKRILSSIINELIKLPRAHKKARPLLRSIFNRFKRVDTSILNDEEVSKMFKSELDRK